VGANSAPQAAWLDFGEGRRRGEVCIVLYIYIDEVIQYIYVSDIEAIEACICFLDDDDDDQGKESGTGKGRKMEERKGEGDKWMEKRKGKEKKEGRGRGREEFCAVVIFPEEKRWRTV